MRHEDFRSLSRRSAIFGSRRFRFGGALLLATLLPWLGRGMFEPGSLDLASGLNALWANALAVMVAFWVRHSVETYPGISSSYVIIPAALAGHGLVVVLLLLARLPYDRVALGGGFAIHVLWNYLAYLYGEHRIRRRFAVVPYGAVAGLGEIEHVIWSRLRRPRLEDTGRCNAIVADFSADLPSEWEAFLADAALAGKIVYQVKQLTESLTGRVELQHLSENSFGSLVPARGYFHFKSGVDFLLAFIALPFVLPLMAVIAAAIRADGPGPILFRQVRVGHSGRRITVYKFRTMRAAQVADQRLAAMTGTDDERVTRVGRYLRRSRLDELPQLFNILKLEMSWIGPRPEAEPLSAWYAEEIPFYRYRHVVKPGISGWAQVNQGHVCDVQSVRAKLQYDFYYIKHFSPWLDLLILFRTIKTMLTGFGSR